MKHFNSMHSCEPCHPERSQSIREANGLAESRDPYPRQSSLCAGTGEGHDFSRADNAIQNIAASAAEARPAKRIMQALLLTIAVFLFLGTGPSTESRFNNLGHRMMCTCGCGQILLECNHVGCQSSSKMRNELQAALDRGDNDDLILQGFVQEYGPTVIAAPTSTGFNKVAWIMPFVVLAAGIAFVTWVVRAWKNRPEPALADGITVPKGDELDQFRAQARKETDV